MALAAGGPAPLAWRALRPWGPTRQNIARKPLRENHLADSNFAWIDTARQALPQAIRLLGQLRPSIHVADLRAIDSDFLERHGTRAILWDVDGTLMGHHGHAVDPIFREAFDRLLARPGLKHALLSNCGEARFLELGRLFPELPVLRAYATPAGLVRRRLLRGEDRWSDPDPATLRSSIRRKIAKPSVALFDCALEELGMADRSKLLMVGDQYFTDIAGANLAGVPSVKVATHRRDSFPLPLRTFQRVEQLLYAMRYPGERGS